MRGMAGKRWLFPVFLGLLLSPCFAACGSIGTGFALSSRNVAGSLEPAALASAPKDAYVETTGRFHVIESGVFSYDDDLQVDAQRARLLSVDGSNVIAYCSESDCPASDELVRVRGRMCDRDRPIVGCDPPDALKTYLEGKVAKRRGHGTYARVLLIGAQPGGDRVQAVIGFSIVGVLFMVWALASIASLRRRPAGARAFEERAVVTRLPREAVAAALRALPGARLVAEEPSSITLAFGRDEGEARMMGITSPEHVPLRLVARWGVDPFRQAQVHLRVEEELPYYVGGIAPQLVAMARDACARTANAAAARLA
jgi:hypothetical protein